MTFTLSPEDIKRCRALALSHSAAVKDIVQAVADESRISTAAIYGPGRMAAVVAARQLCMYLAHMEGLEYAVIGRAMGKDHTTVREAVRREQERRDEESDKAPE